MAPRFLFIGLGNPGEKYEHTRHNIGFLAADAVGKTWGVDPGDWKEKAKFRCLTAEASCGDVPFLLVKPITYMNRSGECVQKIVDYFKLDPSTQIIVCCDDIDLPLGTYRFRLQGSGGTHNGLKSVVDVFGEEFPRLRIGIGPKPEDADLAAWVLSNMTKEEHEELTHVFAHLPLVITRHCEEIAKNS